MLNDGLNKTIESKQDLQNYSAMDSTSSSSTVTNISTDTSTKISEKVKSSKPKSSDKKSPKSASKKISPDLDSQVEPQVELEDKSSVIRDLISLAIRRTRQSLQNNWNAKLASVILAILIWSIISANERATRHMTIPVPLIVLGQPTLNEAYPLPKSVEVRLSGPNNRLEDLKISDLTATVDLRSVTDDFQVRVRVTRPRGIVIESFEPEIIAGKVD